MAVKFMTKLTGDWEKSRQILNNVDGVTSAIHWAVMQEAYAAHRDIVKGITAQAPAGKMFLPLAPLTLVLRRNAKFRGTKALIVSGQLRKSIVVKPAGKGRAFVGVLRNAKRADGKELFNIAKMNEEGATITMNITPRMRIWLMLQLRKANAKNRRRSKTTGKFLKSKFRTTPGQMSTGTVVIRIPPRPFIRPVIEAIFNNPLAARERLTRRIASRMKLTLGKP